MAQWLRTRYVPDYCAAAIGDHYTRLELLRPTLLRKRHARFQRLLSLAPRRVLAPMPQHIGPCVVTQGGLETTRRGAGAYLTLSGALLQ